MQSDNDEEEDMYLIEDENNEIASPYSKTESDSEEDSTTSVMSEVFDENDSIFAEEDDEIIGECNDEDYNFQIDKEARRNAIIQIMHEYKLYQLTNPRN